MGYEIINKELGIAACGINDLTMQQVQHFLGQWEEGAKIGTLTLFFNTETGELVLNKDNENYNTYLELAESYMGAPLEVRKETFYKCPASLRETMKTMENCLKFRNTEKELFRIRKNYITSKKSRRMLETIMSRYDSITAVCMAFRYGEMQGKRVERKKKYKTA